MENIVTKFNKLLDGQTYQFALWDLQKLHEDIEKQLLKFDEIIPYEKQTSAEIFSPRLLNMMLSCCPQIEAITKLISERCDFPLNETNNENNDRKKPISVPKLIKKINENGVLSNLFLQVKMHDYGAGFTPFEQGMKWWQKYADLKHGLTFKHTEINYTHVMEAFTALAGLHCIASMIERFYNYDPLDILDKNNWRAPITANYKRNDYGEFYEHRSYYWESLVFGTRKYFDPPAMGAPTRP